jgi:CPA2 family monovalent cation:H+ antiporter-2
VVTTTAVFACIAAAFGVPWLMAIVIGGALSMSSTAIIVHQLTDRAELNRTHGRLAFSMLLFQDLAFVPFLALASALSRRDSFSLASTAISVVGGIIAIGVVLVVGRWLLRPLFHEIARSRLRELFTLAALFVVLSSAWVSHSAGLSLALGGFLSGMMLGETEYRHQIEIVIRPFRDILLGMFFITVGMLLDVRLLISEFVVVFSLLLGIVILKAAAAAMATRGFVDSWFKSIRTGIVISIAGEFGIALLTIVLQDGALPTRIG